MAERKLKSNRVSDDHVDVVRPRMIKFLKKSQNATAKIDFIKVTEGEARMNAAHAALNGEPYGYTKPGRYAILYLKSGEGWQTWMSDTDMEWLTNSPVLAKARDHVLIFGLGLAFIIKAILDKGDRIKTITVVEKNPDVIALVEPLIRKWKGEKKITIINDDAYTWEPAEGDRQKFDTIYFDIWQSISGNNWPQMAKLERKWVKRMRPGGWLGFWRDLKCKRLYVREKREDRLLYAPIGGRLP